MDLLGHPSRLAVFGERQNRLGLRRRLWPATEREQCIGSRVPAEGGVRQGETHRRGLVDADFAERQRLLITTGLDQVEGKIERRPGDILVGSVTAS